METECQKEEEASYWKNKHDELMKLHLREQEKNRKLVKALDDIQNNFELLRQAQDTYNDLLIITMTSLSEKESQVM